MNLYGLYILYLKELRRFLKVYHQTIFTPAISSLILLAIFSLAMDENHSLQIKGVPFVDFIGYGLIIMSITQNAFANSSSSLIMSKVIGYITDLLIPPLRGFEIVTAYTLGALTRGLMVGAVVSICLSPFVSFRLHSLGLLIFFTTSSGMLLGLLGILTGLISNTFEQNSAVTNYIINPLSFLSGTFYSVEKLPYFFKLINYINPFFYMIDGFRYSIIGVSDSNIEVGVAVLMLTNFVLFFLLKHLIDIGWRLKT
jgi:ABC-2 type transport system permease protein